MAAGTLGGLTSWLIQALLGVRPFDKPAYFAIPALLVIGAVAAALGVFLIANSDTSEPRHTLAFALVCGMFWQPVIQTGEAFVAHTATQRQVALLQDSGDELSRALLSDPAKVQQKVAATATITSELIQKLPTVHDPELRFKLMEQSTQVVNKIEDASKNSPQSSVDGLQKIGVAAAQSGQTDVAKNVLLKLNTISNRSPQVAAQAKEASALISARAGVPVMKLDAVAPK
ncbi:MAG: hypothetical protein HYR55_09410 [Acidobacteria bacterium]|nr:hypothetical protein [Acidobacteriota bacterium]MBI3657707.1 hypothetical protein [Acidobacteriota bacterium]